MTTVRITLMVLLAMATAPVSATDWPESILVILDGQPEQHLLGVHTARQQEVSVVVMDVAPIGLLEENLGRGLYPDTDRAGRQAERRIGRLTEAKKRQAINSAIARSTAAAFGVRRFPAIIINRRFVFEGLYDLRDAVRRWRNQHRSKP